MEFWLLNNWNKYILSQKLNKGLLVLGEASMNKGEDILNIFKKPNSLYQYIPGGMTYIF